MLLCANLLWFDLDERGGAMTDRQILGFMAFVQVMLAICGIVELHRAVSLFKAGIEFMALQREP